MYLTALRPDWAQEQRAGQGPPLPDRNFHRKAQHLRSEPQFLHSSGLSHPAVAVPFGAVVQPPLRQKRCYSPEMNLPLPAAQTGPPAPSPAHSPSGEIVPDKTPPPIAAAGLWSR
ncbi:hypothetical protein FACS189473_1760 [Spirochaetia bacterium]|nr:hypothetical protein FACS189473_1760 [Spirochaetia bacterium]